MKSRFTPWVSRQHFICWSQKIAVGLGQLLLILSLVFSGLSTAPAAAANLGQVPPVPTVPTSTDRAAQKVDRASDKIYEGLDTTKDIIGKTEGRKQVIEQGRQKASQKLEALADKAKSADNPDAALTKQEKMVIDQLQDKQ